ncbi:MAG: response regulator [Deltaproteobacteria bacterium]|nr:response regulator [Deltaproteobacteria bacterium]
MPLGTLGAVGGRPGDEPPKGRDAVDLDDTRAQEKRRYARYPYTLCVRCQPAPPVNADWTENLSLGGAFVRTDQPLCAGQQVVATVSFPGLLEPMNVPARVAWVRSLDAMTGGGVGVEFVDSQPAARLKSLLDDSGAPNAGVEAEPFRLLVAEDNARLAATYERLVDQLPTVRAAGISARFATDGRQALDLIEAQGVDMVITDIYMPVMDGYELIRRLRADLATSRIPIMVVTGGRGDERKKVEDLGADAFSFKPMFFGRLLETIARLVQFRRREVNVLQ